MQQRRHPKPKSPKASDRTQPSHGSLRRLTGEELKRELDAGAETKFAQKSPLGVIKNHQIYITGLREQDNNGSSIPSIKLYLKRAQDYIEGVLFNLEIEISLLSLVSELAERRSELEQRQSLAKSIIIKQAEFQTLQQEIEKQYPEHFKNNKKRGIFTCLSGSTGTPEKKARVEHKKESPLKKDAFRSPMKMRG